MSALLRDVRQRWSQAVEKRPFLRLIGHFLDRVASGGAASSDVNLGIAGALALLAVPGAFTAIYLSGKYSSLLQWLRGNPLFNPYRVCIPDEYFFIVYSMAITGLVTLMRWDRLLPGRQDFANLAPLPLKLRDIFLANITALGGIAIIFAVDVNAVSAILFPLLVTLKEGTLVAFVRFASAHAVAVLGISLFTFLALLALQSLLMSLLPDTVYRRVSLVLRTVLLVFFVSLLISAFVLPLSIFNFKMKPGGAGNWWPPLWFLSLFESRLAPLRNNAAIPPQFAISAVFGSLAVAIAGFTLSYRRYFLRIAERREGPGNSAQRRFFRLHSLGRMSRLSLRPGPEAACYGFIVKTLVRNDTQLLLFGIWAGLGLLLAGEGFLPGATGTGGLRRDVVLGAPLMLAFFVLTGMRFAFDLPARVDANWLFRLAAADRPEWLPRVCRKAMLSFVLPWLLAIWLPLAALALGWQDAMIAAFIDMLLVVLTVDVLLLGFRKIPFTCSFTANRDRLLRLVAASTIALVFVIPLLVEIEISILAKLWKLLILLPVLAAALILLRSRRPEPGNATMFDDKGVEPFALLHLSGD